MITIRLITREKEAYLPLLLIGDEQLSVVSEYLSQSTLYALHEPDISEAALAVCAVTLNGDTAEIRCLAVNPAYRGRGYGSALVDYVTQAYRYDARKVIVGCTEATVPFYTRLGFIRDSVRPGFYTDHYDHPIIENGSVLRDMQVLRRDIVEHHNARISFRIETPEDYAEVESMTRDAFWNIYKPGCDEHFILSLLRESPAYFPEMHLLAVADGQIVGSIVWSEAVVVDPNGYCHPVLAFGPLTVRPGWQREGIGGKLIEHTLSMARKTDYPAVVICGAPAYYRRFGFRSARDFGLHMPDGTVFDAFMALELKPGMMNRVSGSFYEDDAFAVNDPAALAAFDAEFPRKTMMKTPTQLG